MKTFLVIYLSLVMIVISVFFIDRFIPVKPKGKFGKWWLKNIIQREND
jgi:hypothetical protein